MGAAAVLVGRPVLWALTLGGQAGVEQALRMLQSELELGMALLGCRSVQEVTRDFLLAPPAPFCIPQARL